MIIYIAGKITGLYDYIAPFTRAEAFLSAGGNTVLNPTILPEGLKGWDDYMHVCYALIDVSDAVYLLPGWEGSRGAREERIYAYHTGKIVIYGKEDDNENTAAIGF